MSKDSIVTQRYCWMRRPATIGRIRSADAQIVPLDALLSRRRFSMRSRSSQFRAFEPLPSDQISVRASADENAVSGPPDGGSDELAPSSATTPRNAESFSRGLVDTYFRQMGDAAWLSREEEVALAKRMEASQRATLTSLCRVPMLVKRIASWGREVAEGRLRLADLIDLSVAKAETGARDVAHGCDVVAADPENGDPEALANGEAENVSVTTVRLQTIIALADEIGSLSRKQLAAAARGRKLAKHSRARLHELTSGFLIQPLQCLAEVLSPPSICWPITAMAR